MTKTKDQPILLSAGPLSLIFEPDTVFLRTIRLGEIEVLRGIYSAVRDHNWDTALPVLSNLRREEHDDGFRLSFDVDARLGEAAFFWKGTITGAADGTVRFEMDGEAKTTFRRNRIGFCVLHSLACAGMPCMLGHTDGSTERSGFPEIISPHQPFLDLRSISHEVSKGVTATVEFEGDVFETEDQRNWTDASFKTYCTPLAQPFPVTVEKGTRIRQAVTLRLQGAEKMMPAQPATERLTTGVEANVTWRMPSIGLGMASHREALSNREIERLRAVHAGFLRVDVHFGESGWKTFLRQAMDQAFQLDMGLEVALHLTAKSSTELEALNDVWRPMMSEAGGFIPVARWLVLDAESFCTTEDLLNAARKVLPGLDPSAPIFAGTNAYFTQLNRASLPLSEFDGLCYSINPQVHAFDDRTMFENTEAQADTVRTARFKAPRAAVAVTPVTLKPRFNPDATGPDRRSRSGELPASVEPRQCRRMAACWTLASLANLARGGADSATFFETTGWCGIMETESGSPLPNKFPSSAGGVFPLYHVLVDVATNKESEVHPIRTHDPLRLMGLAFKNDDHAVLLLANLSGKRIEAAIQFPSCQRATVRLLDENSEREAITDPESFRSRGFDLPSADETTVLSLDSYVYARIDLFEISDWR